MREDGAVESVWDQGPVVPGSVSLLSSLEVRAQLFKTNDLVS